MRRVVLVGPPPVQILDVAGPLEVFANAPDYELNLATPGSGASLLTDRGLKLGQATPLHQLRSPIDTLVVVSGPGAESGEPNRELVDWIVQHAPVCRRVAAICTGAFVAEYSGARRPNAPMSEFVALWSWHARAEMPTVSVVGTTHKETGIMPSNPSSLGVPDSQLAAQITEFIRDNETELLFNHSSRVYCFAALQGRKQALASIPSCSTRARCSTTSALCPRTAAPRTASRSTARTPPATS